MEAKDLLIPLLAAFFAFLFFRVADFLTDLYERNKKNELRLRLFDLKLNETLSTIGDNLFVCEQFEKFHKNGLFNNGNIVYVANTFSKYNVDRDGILELNNIDLINEIFLMYGQLNKLNDDFLMIKGAYDKAYERFQNKIIDAKGLEANVSRFLTSIDELKNHLGSFYEDTKHALAAVRVSIKTTKTIPTIVYAFVSKIVIRRKIKEADVLKELQKLNDEINSNRSEQAIRLREILGSTNSRET